MFTRCLFVMVVAVSLVSCANYRQAKAPWVGDVNGALIGAPSESAPDNTGTTDEHLQNERDKANAYVSDVSCVDSEDGDAYSVSVVWTATTETVSSVTVEYDFGAEGQDVLIDPQVAEELKGADAFASGSATFNILKSDVPADVTAILTRVVVRNFLGAGAFSPVSSFPLSSACE